MPTLCIQCALEAFVAADGVLRDGNALQSYGMFDQSPDEHMRSHHAEPVDMEKRRELEVAAQRILDRELA